MIHVMDKRWCKLEQKGDALYLNYVFYVTGDRITLKINNQGKVILHDFKWSVKTSNFDIYLGERVILRRIKEEGLYRNMILNGKTLGKPITRKKEIPKTKKALESLKVLIICVSHHLGQVVPELFEALQDMARHTTNSEGHETDTIDLIILTEQPRKNGKMIPGNQARHFNMNKIKEYAIKNGYDYLIKVDSDMIPPKQGLLRLIQTSEANNTQIVTSLTPERPFKCGTDYFSQLMSWNYNEGRTDKIPTMIKQQKPFVCTGNAGEAFMLISRQALTKIIWPPCKDRGDYAFWDLVHQKNIKTLCDPQVICAHKERSGKHKGQLIRGTQWVVRYWKNMVLNNVRAGRAWYHGIPYSWWRGESQELFLTKLPQHIESGNENLWLTYEGAIK